jgi:hypothetical protein
VSDQYLLAGPALDREVDVVGVALLRATRCHGGLCPLQPPAAARRKRVTAEEPVCIDVYEQSMFSCSECAEHDQQTRVLSRLLGAGAHRSFSRRSMYTTWHSPARHLSH